MIVNIIKENAIIASEWRYRTAKKIGSMVVHSSAFPATITTSGTPYISVYTIYLIELSVEELLEWQDIIP